MKFHEMCFLKRRANLSGLDSGRNAELERDRLPRTKRRKQALSVHWLAIWIEQVKKGKKGKKGMEGMPADPGAGSAGPGGKRGPPAPPPGAMKKMKKGPLNMEVSRAESTDTK